MVKRFELKQKDVVFLFLLDTTSSTLHASTSYSSYSTLYTWLSCSQCCCPWWSDWTTGIHTTVLILRLVYKTIKKTFIVVLFIFFFSPFFHLVLESEMNTLMFHQQTSYHRHYQIRHSN
jgi:hypothetical protein